MSDPVILSPRFESSEGWGPGFALAKDSGPGVVVGPGSTSPNVFAQSFVTSPGAQYVATLRGSSIDPSTAIGAIQINWHDSSGKFITVTKRLFELSPAESRHEAVIVAPRGAASGTLYVTPGAPLDVVRYTEMSLKRLHPVSDFLDYRFAGLSGDILLAIAGAILVALFFRRRVCAALGTALGEEKADGTAPSAALRWLIPGLAAVSTAALFIFLEGIYELNYDAQWHQASIESVMRWKAFSLDLGGDPLHNFGIFHAINPQLSPTFWVGWLFGPDHRIQVQGAVQALIFFLVLFRIARFSGAGRNDAAALALIATAYITVPLLSNGTVTNNATLGLLWQEGAIASLVAFLCFACIGNRQVGPLARRLSAPGLAAATLWIALSFPELTAFYALTTAALCLGALAASQGRQELFWKIGSSTLILILLLGLGFAQYIVNLYGYTPQLLFGTLQTSQYPFLSPNNSLLLRIPAETAGPTYLFFALAATGTLITLLSGNPFARGVAFAALSLELFVYAASFLNAVFGRIPIAFLYVEQTGMAVLALMAAAAVWAFARALARLMVSLLAVLRVLSSEQKWVWSRGVSFALLAIMVLLLIHRLASDDYHGISSWPPRTGTTAARIQSDILSVHPGDVFKGRGVVLLGMQHPGTLDWGSHVSVILDQNFRGAFGSDLMTHAEAADVPMVNDYGHWLSPAMLTLFAAAFYDPIDPIGRAAQVPRRFRANLARLLGVSLVISDQEIPGQALLYRTQALGHPVFIHRVVDANVGQYSPTRAEVAGDAHRILDLLQAPDFDGRYVAVVEQPIAGELVSARSVTIRLERGPKLVMDAESNARSLLVLPFEFSHCLRISGTGVERMLPVNLSQTGVLIRGRATFEIVYRYGLTSDVTCRKRDIQRFRTLNVEEAATGRLFRDTGPPS